MINLIVQLVSQLQSYGAISSSNITASNNSNSNFTTEKDSSSNAGSTPLESTGTAEMMGLAVFNQDKLIGELSARETLCHLMIRNKFESCNITIPNPEDKNTSIDLYVYNKSKPKIKVKIVNGSPLITLDIQLESKILSVDNNSNYISEEKLSDISTSASQYIESIISEYLYKTAKEFHTDIDGFGRYALPLFTTTQEFENYNWLDNYQNSFFDVNIKANVQSAFLLSGK